VWPRLGDPDRLQPHELGLELRISVLEEHLDDLAEVALHLIRGVSLAVSTWPSRYPADEDPGIGVAFDDYVVGADDISS
jgi:hypothetical protein